MARKYGGKFSPDSSDAQGPDQTDAVLYRGAQVDPAGARANLMFLPAALVLFTSLMSGAAGLALGVASAGVLALSAWMLRNGLRAEAAYNARKVARSPGIPRKLFSSVLAGAGIAIAAYKAEPGVVAPVHVWLGRPRAVCVDKPAVSAAYPGSRCRRPGADGAERAVAGVHVGERVILA